MQEWFELDTLEQQQGIFGTQDTLMEQIEAAMSVTVVSRGTRIEINGDTESAVRDTLSILRCMVKLFNRGETLNSDMVSRLIEQAKDGTLEETFQAMDCIVTVSSKGTPIKCKTMGQRNYIRALRENTVTICIGPAGTGKTYLAVAQAAKELKDGEIERIIMSRPAIEAGEERLGFLPGDLAQKVDPYLRPLYDALYDIFGTEKAEKLREKGAIEIAPLAYMRGRTLNNARVIIDESQNASLSTLKMVLTRLGEGSKMILTGDVTQIDLPSKEDSGLERCAAIVSGVEGLTVIHLNNRDVVRNRIVKDIVKAFEKFDVEKGKTAPQKRYRPAPVNGGRKWQGSK